MGIIATAFRKQKRFGDLPEDCLKYVIFNFLEVDDIYKFRAVSRKFNNFVKINLSQRNMNGNECLEVMEKKPSEKFWIDFLSSNVNQLIECRRYLLGYSIIMNFKVMYHMIIRKFESYSTPCVGEKQLFLAVKYNRGYAVRDFLQLKYVDRSWISGRVVNMAAKSGFLPILKMLVSAGNVDLGQDRNIALRLACENGKVNIVKYFLKRDDVNPSDFGNAAVGYAAGSGHINVVKLLLADPRVDCTDEHNYCIRQASLNNHYKVLELLLRQRNVDPTDFENFALRFSAGRGHWRVVRILLGNNRVRRCRNAVKSALSNATDVNCKYLLKKCLKETKGKYVSRIWT